MAMTSLKSWYTGFMRLLEGKTVVVIGAGPVGLGMAKLLTVHGIEPIVLERNGPDFHLGQGGSLDLTEAQGQAALTAMGLRDEFEKYSRPQGQHYTLTDSQAHECAVIETADMGQTRPEIDRGDLRTIIYKSFPTDLAHIFQWNTRVVSINPAGDAHLVTTDSGREIRADLVICADGIGSIGRKLWTKDVPHYIGDTTIITYVTHPIPEEFDKLVGPGTLFAFGEDTLFMGQRDSQGNIFAYYNTHFDDDPTGRSLLKATSQNQPDDAYTRDLLLERYQHWGSFATEILANPERTFRWWPLYSMPPGQKWHQHGPITAIGDAAHVMPPYTGLGVNYGMYDTMVLTEQLLRQNTITAAIAAYEEEMLQRMKPAIELTQESQKTRFSSAGFQHFQAQLTQKAPH